MVRQTISWNLDGTRSDRPTTCYADMRAPPEIPCRPLRRRRGRRPTRRSSRSTSPSTPVRPSQPSASPSSPARRASTIVHHSPATTSIDCPFNWAVENGHHHPGTSATDPLLPQTAILHPRPDRDTLPVGAPAAAPEPKDMPAISLHRRCSQRLYYCKAVTVGHGWKYGITSGYQCHGPSPPTSPCTRRSGCDFPVAALTAARPPPPLPPLYRCMAY